MFEIFSLTLNAPIRRSNGAPYRYTSRADAERAARLCWDGRCDVVVRPVEV